MQKVSVTLPAEVVAKAKCRAGEGGFSRYVAAGLERQLEEDERDENLGKLMEDWQAEFGEFTEVERARARSILFDWDPGSFSTQAES